MIRDKGLGFRDYSLGFMGIILGLGVRVYSLGFMVNNLYKPLDNPNYSHY